MTNLFAALLFGGFVALIVIAARTQSRRWIDALIVYVVAASLGVGTLQRVDAWPFSLWPLIALNHPPTATHPRVMAVDAAGVEHRIDARAWEPFSFLEISSWLSGPFPRLGEREKAAAFAYLLEHVERARREGVRTPGAPYFILNRYWWRDGAPRQPFVALRLYRDTWPLDDPKAVVSTLVFEYRSNAR